MIGAIVLTLRDRKTSRHQVISVQTARTRADTLVVMRPALNEGVDRIYRPLARDSSEAAADELAPAPADGAR